MTNFEAGKGLIREAEEYWEEVERAFLRSSWNVVIRKSQEVVELAQKGLLKILGIEYPKVHDPSDFFLRVLEKRGIPLSPDVAKKVAQISAELAAKRAPAFYFEKSYDSQEAQEAKEGAHFVLEVVQKILRQIKPPEVP